MEAPCYGASLGTEARAVQAPELSGRAIKPYSANIIDITIDISVVVIAICKRTSTGPYKCSWLFL
jgi:hypothetical protein